MPDRSELVTRLIIRHPRFQTAGRGRYGVTSAATKMVEFALKLWPDLTMAEFAAGLADANKLASAARALETAAEKRATS